ncbi:MAG: MBL fold metallo-hydrolase [Ardenticatenales bacterium]|nr:MBL fold metallo-hydrolase [Ardenticatenales bacterium]
MNIKWYGHACFRLKDTQGTVFTDPFPMKGIGYSRPRTKAEIVTISHDHPNHASLDGFTNEPYVITRPGEYEVNGIFVTTIRTYHDDEKGNQRGYNNITLVQFDDLSVCHLGDLAHLLTQSDVEKLNEVDVLLVPVGGANGNTLNAAQAAEVISLIEPYYVVPMHYQTEVHSGGLDSLDKFLKEMGTSSPEVLDELKVSRSTLPEETQVVVLGYS